MAIYGGHCPRHHRQARALQAGHRLLLRSVQALLELEPQLRRSSSVLRQQIWTVSEALEDMKDNLLLDIYLAPHYTFSMIRNRGLVQYFTPFQLSADLNKMANSFNTPVINLENELMKLISGWQQPRPGLTPQQGAAGPGRWLLSAARPSPRQWRWPSCTREEPRMLVLRSAIPRLISVSSAMPGTSQITTTQQWSHN